MKRNLILLFSIFALLVPTVLSASDLTKNLRISPYGWHLEDGELVLSIPSTLLAVDIEVEQTEFKPGVFARYALKYLGVSAEMTGKSESKISNAAISIVEDKSLTTSTLAEDKERSAEISQSANLVVATSQGSVKFSEESRAAAFAKRLFAIRQQRNDLIAGDVGEGVFGAGLAAALDDIAGEEREILRMFMGETTTSKSVKKFYVKPEANAFNYILCRFSERDGLRELSDVAAAPIYLQISTMATPELDEAQLTAKGEYRFPVMQYMIAAESMCTLYNNTQSVATAILPIFEFGRIYTLEIPNSYYLKHFGREFK